MLTLAVMAVLLSPAAHTAPHGQTGEAPAPSVERVRGALSRPGLQLPPLPELTPTFRLTVEEQLFPHETVLEAMRRDLAARPGSAAPGPGGVDLLGLAMGVVEKLNDVRRRRAEAQARRVVRDALDQFCASHDCSVTEPGVGLREGVILPSTPR